MNKKKAAVKQLFLFVAWLLSIVYLKLFKVDFLTNCQIYE
jgi:hypothetical protein